MQRNFMFLPQVVPISEKEEALIQASMSGDLEAVKKYVSEGVNMNVIHKEYGDTALSQAAFKGYVSIVDFFMTFPLSAYNKSIALVLATQAGHDLIVEKLIRSGAELNFEANTLLFYYQPALHQSIVHNRPDAFNRLVIANGINLNFPDKNKQTPLLLSVLHNRFDMFKKLIELGANLNTKHDQGQTLLDVVRQKNYLHMLEYIQAIQSKKSNGLS